MQTRPGQGALRSGANIRLRPDPLIASPVLQGQEAIMLSNFQKLCREADKKKKAAERAAKKAKTNGKAEPETPPPPPPPPSLEELEAAARDLISDPDILARFGTEVEIAGLVGETSNAKILYLALTSRMFERPVSIAIKGVSSVGKSFTVERVLEFFPPAAYFVRTGMSERAIIYSDESYRHRFLILFEAAGMNSEMQSYLIRTLLSEGRVVYEVVEKTKAGLRPRRIEKEGPTGLITTTTAPKLHPENETRLLSLGVIDTPDQTKAVMLAVAADNAGATALNYSPWRAFQAWLAAGRCEVVVPFAPTLADLIPPLAVRLRRDFKLLLALIRAHALLHRATRQRDPHDRITATVTDYAAVRELVAKLFADGVEATVPKTIRETVAAVEAGVGDGVGGGVGGGEISLTALARQLKLDKNSTHHRVKRAIERGYLVNREEKRGKPARIAIADPLPDEIEILPSADVLGDCWRVGVQTEGIKEDTEEDAQTEEDGQTELGQAVSLLPLHPSSNTPTPPVPSPVPSDYDAILEEQAAQGTNGFRPPLGEGWHLVGDLPPEKAGAAVWLREIRVPAIAAGIADDIEDILEPRWRQ
jgi:hypothetical protein